MWRFDVINTRRLSIFTVCFPQQYGPILEHLYPEQQIIVNLSTHILMNNFINDIHNTHIHIFLKILISNIQNHVYIQINSCDLDMQKPIKCSIKND